MLHSYYPVVHEAVLFEIRNMPFPQVPKAGAIETLLQLVQEVDFEAQAGTLILFAEDLSLLGEAAFGLGEALFCKLRLASCDLVLFLKELTLLVELASSEHGRPDGAYARGDAAYGYNEGEERVHCRGFSPFAFLEGRMC